MDFDLPGDDHPARTAVRDWLGAHPSPTFRQLAEAGYVAPHWPRPWGRDADPVTQIVIDQELKRGRVARPYNPIGIGWAGPTLLHAGTDAQKDRYLMPLLAGEEVWCQLFSEPGAGSDLANLSTRAVRDGDEYVVTGQKIWTSLAQFATHGILLARTDPDAPKRKGISYFIFPMRSPGVEVRPIVEMTGSTQFAEVFIDEVRIPAENLVGEEHEGWPLARITLANERVSLSSGGALWGMGPTAGDLVAIARSQDCLDPLLRNRLVRMHIESRILELLNWRMITERVHGRQPGAQAAVKKIVADEHGQKLMDLAKDFAGAGGLLADRGPFHGPAGEWHWGFLYSPALTIGGGTGQVLRSLAAERILGLPREPDVERGLAWSERA